MNFFERQAQARRRSTILVGWLLLAVVLIVVVLNAALFGIAVVTGYVEPDPAAWLSTGLSKFCTLGVLLTICITTLVRHFDLRSGGDAVARLLHARPLDPTTTEPLERRFANVVDEMAIASGTPPPTLWLLDNEPGINAMVAGYRPGEAAMIVTRGALEVLNRDELQGVVGHEFSHILNGDMRLNVRIIALLAGILALGVAGRGLLRVMMYSGRGIGSARRRGHASKADAQGGVAGLAMIALVGSVLLIVIGYIGTLVGRIIKASVSRQREYLADASAVQFTRSSDGIAGALFKIKQHAGGSKMVEPRAEETAHMLFGDGLSLHGLFATHPPLDERISAIDPRFLIRAEQRDERAGQQEREQRERAHVGGEGAALVGLGAAALAATVGTHTPAHVAHARKMVGEWPDALLQAVHHPRNAAYVVYTLLLGEMRAAYRGAALEDLTEREGSGAVRTCNVLLPLLSDVSKASRLPLLEMCLPALRRAHISHRERLLDTARRLIAADGRKTVFEFSLLALLEHHLRARSGRRDRVRHSSMAPLQAEVSALLTLMARAGARDADSARRAFEAAERTLGLPGLVPSSARAGGLSALPAQLENLSGLSPLLKQPLLEACAAAVMSDGEIRVAEAELLRAVSATLDCPLPPILDAVPEQS